MLDNYLSDALGKLSLRLSVGGLMLFHGVAKMMHPGTVEFIGRSLSKVDMPSSLAYAVFLGEIVAPLMIIFGYRARLGGLILMVNMIFAVGLVHMGDIFSLSKHGGWFLELQALYLFGGLAITLLGSGRFAVRPD